MDRTPRRGEGADEGGGTARRKAAEQAIQSAGGKIESFHFAFGEDDVYVVGVAK